jgi:DNA-binding IclR family transcriptional regulator
MRSCEPCGGTYKVKILRHLANTRLEMSGRQIASDIGMSPWACHRALQDLTDQGVLVMRNRRRPPARGGS